jgi:diguanylate cyclase (GGDEF)-like protein
MTYRAAPQEKPDAIADPRGILVVEDSKTFSLALRQFLDREVGLPVTTCASFNELTHLVGQDGSDYAIAVVDLNLPDAPHGEALDFTIARGIPTIVFTGAFDTKTRNRIMARDVIDYVVKDNELALPTITGAVKRALENRQTRILVVDDIGTARQLLVRMLTVQQYSVLEAGSGAEALAILEANPDIQLVVTDYNMPDINGYELTRRIRKKFSPEKLRVIGVSSTNDRTVSAGFLKVGASDFISRPFVPEELQCRIASNAETLTQLRQLRELASRDYLTGLFNRRYFFENGARLVQDARERGLPCSIALIDIDNFKQLNDTHGHVAGDTGLKVIAKCLEQSLAGTDHLVARLGGEEFGILLMGVTASAALRMADHIRLDVSYATVPIGEETVSLTISVGVTELSGEHDLDHYVNQADHALYQAKQGGRNRVCLAAPETN